MIFINLELAENTLEVFEAHKENSDKFKQNYLEVDLLNYTVKPIHIVNPNKNYKFKPIKFLNKVKLVEMIIMVEVTVN